MRAPSHMILVVLLAGCTRGGGESGKKGEESASPTPEPAVAATVAPEEISPVAPATVPPRPELRRPADEVAVARREPVETPHIVGAAASDPAPALRSPAVSEALPKAIEKSPHPDILKAIYMKTGGGPLLISGLQPSAEAHALARLVTALPAQMAPHK